LEVAERRAGVDSDHRKAENEVERGWLFALGLSHRQPLLEVGRDWLLDLGLAVAVRAEGLELLESAGRMLGLGPVGYWSLPYAQIRAVE
jgi:hypothetical protein